MRTTPGQNRAVKPREENGWAAYLLVPVFVITSTLARLALDPVLGGQAPFSFHFIAVVLSAWVAGLPGGLVATLLSVVAATYFFIEPRQALALSTADRGAAALVFVGVAVLLSWQTSRWRAAERLSRHRQRELTALMNAATESIWLLDREQVLAANTTAAARMGSSVEQLRGRSWESLLPPDLAASRYQKLDQVFTTGQPVRFEDEGGGVLFDHTYYPVFSDRDEVTAVAAFSRDITEPRKAEQQVRETEQRLAHHVAQSPLAVIEFGPDMRLTQWTGAAERIFGCNADEVLGKRMDEFRWVYDEDTGSVADVSSDLQSGRDPLRRSTNRNYRKDGTVIWCEWNNSSLFNEEGRLRSILSLVLDVTDRHRLEHELRAQAEQLVAANRIKDEFLATLSHELRTPLNAILGWAQILSNDSLPADRRKHGMATIARNAHMQAQLVDDLLDVSRIMNATLRLNLEVVDVRSVAAQALDAVRPAADAKALTLSTDIDASLRVHADPVRLQQVIWNLLSNAVKFTPPGGGVTITARRERSDAAITVQDSGMGIPPAFLPHVFERFRQADSSSTRTHGGLGLGLAIVRHIVELHGGSVTVLSEGEGRGASFTVRLPSVVRQTAVTRDGPSDSPAGDERQLAGVRVLVVDDDRDSLDVVEEMLRAAEAEVVCAESAEEALDVLDDFAPHALISDLAMPATDGFEFIRRLRASGRSLPAVALTAYGGTPERQAALRAGFDAHLVKPAIARTLVTTVASLVR
jgi:PAS domain S-box-containing protein